MVLFEAILKSGRYASQVSIYLYSAFISFSEDVRLPAGFGVSAGGSRCPRPRCALIKNKCVSEGFVIPPFTFVLFSSDLLLSVRFCLNY